MSLESVSFINKKSKNGIIVQRVYRIIIGLLCVGCSCGFLLNNLWRVMPEFHHLDVFFCIPLYVQITLLLISISFGLLLSRKKSNLLIFTLFFFSLFLSIASWYHVNVSNSTNSFSITLLPLYEQKVKFDAIQTVTFAKYRIILKTTPGIYSVRTGLYPFGLNSDSLKETLLGYGNCVRKSDNRCIEMEFAWP